MMEIIEASIIWFVIIGIVLRVKYLAYQHGIGKNIHMLNKDKTEKRVFFIYMVVTFFGILYLILQNRFIYYWDYGGYWTLSYNYMGQFFQNPVEALETLYDSILYNDYNLLIPIFLALPLQVFGYTFQRYVCINFVMFFLPTVFLIFSIGKKLLLNEKVNKKYSMVLLTILLVCFNIFYIPMLDGYADVACLIPTALTILLYMDYDALSLERKQIVRDVFITVNLIATFLMRRYFAYYIVGYIVALFFSSIYKIWSKKENTSSIWERIRPAIINLAIIGGLALMIFIIFFRPLVERIVSNNLSNQYAAYDMGLKDKIMRVVHTYGYVIIFLACLGLLFSLLRKKYRNIASFCMICIIVTSLSFFTVQSMGIQHMYLLVIPLFLLNFIAVIHILEFAKKRKLGIIAIVLSYLVLICGTFHCYDLKSRKMLEAGANLYTTVYNPLQRNDIDVLHQLANYLNTLTDNNNKKIYVVASGSILNQSILKSLDAPYGNDPVHNMVNTSNVDLRDGFPTDFLDSDIIVTTDPIQTHLLKGQEVIRFLAQEISDSNSCIGRHFVRDMQTFQLDDGVQVYIYQKQSEFEKTDLQYLSDYYMQLYPDKAQLFSDRILGGEMQ